MRRIPLILLLFVLVGTLTLSAQTPAPTPGMHLACLTVKNSTTTIASTGEIYLVDTATLKAHKLLVPKLAATVGFNAIMSQTPVSGYVTTIDTLATATPASAGDIFRYVIANGSVSLTKLNTSPFTGGNLAQICLVGSKLYVSSQTAAGAQGLLWSIPIAGGAPTKEVDFSTVTGYAGALINACTAYKGLVYIASGFGGTADEVWSFNPTTKAVTKVITLPTTGIYSTKAYPVNLTVDTKMNALVVVGLYRDLIYIDLATNKLIKAVNGGKYQTSTSKVHYHQMLNSGWYNPDTDDIALGSRTGFLDIHTGSHGSLDLVPGVGSATTATLNSVTGVAYIPRGITCSSYGDGGMGSPATATYRFYPLNLSIGLPSAGNTWGLRLVGGEGGVPAVLAIGISKTAFGPVPLPFDLAFLGATGNSLLCSQDLIFSTVLAGTGNGLGTASFSFKLPIEIAGATLYSQWLVMDKGANTLGLVVSNAREALCK